MTNLLVRLFVKDRDNLADRDVRNAYGRLSGLVGIFTNVILVLGKLFIGAISGSIAIIADAFNNITDVVSSVLTVAGFKLASKPPDKGHPYGHGRYEYVTGLLIAFLTLVVALEFIKTSILRILNPSPISFSWVALIILVISILTKIWLAVFNTKLGKKIDSTAMAATALDSMSDVGATSVTLIALILSKFTSFPVDGFAGILVALFILYSGVNIARETLDLLIGKRPDRKLIDEIEKRVVSYDGIIGIHDVMVHNYGPGSYIATAHAEVSAAGNMLELHDVIDCVEKDIFEELQVHLTLHMDPIDVEDARTIELRDQVLAIVQSIGPKMSIHDFRMVSGESHTNLIFDVAVPWGCELSDENIKKEIQEKISSMNKKYYLVMEIDKV